MKKRMLFVAFTILISCNNKQVAYNETNTNYVNFDFSAKLPSLREGQFRLIPLPDTIDFDYHKQIGTTPLTENEFLPFYLKIDTLAYCRNIKVQSIDGTNDDFRYNYPKKINATGSTIGKIQLDKDLFGYLLLSSYKNSETQCIYLFVCKGKKICSVACLSYWSVNKEGVSNSFRTFFLNRKKFVCVSVVRTTVENTSKNKGDNFIVHHSVLSINEDGRIICSSESNSRIDQITDNIQNWKYIQPFVNM